MGQEKNNPIETIPNLLGNLGLLTLKSQIDPQSTGQHPFEVPQILEA
jgi:hypothetical protein